MWASWAWGFHPEPPPLMVIWCCYEIVFAPFSDISCRQTGTNTSELHLLKSAGKHGEILLFFWARDWNCYIYFPPFEIQVSFFNFIAAILEFVGAFYLFFIGKTPAIFAMLLTPDIFLEMCISFTIAFLGQFISEKNQSPLYVSTLPVLLTFVLYFHDAFCNLINK